MKTERREDVAHFAGKPTRLSRALALLPQSARTRVQRQLRRRAIIPSYPHHFPGPGGQQNAQRVFPGAQKVRRLEVFENRKEMKSDGYYR